LGTLATVLAALAAGILIWFLYKYIKHNPEMLSKEKLSASFNTMGFLGIGLIIFIGLVVFLLKA